jgi:hypothetical protein
MLTTGETYRDLGGDYFTNRDPNARRNASDTTRADERPLQGPRRMCPVSTKGSSSTFWAQPSWLGRRIRLKRL